jgi:pyruvate ferredoxin oxidoreductase delta subunit
MRFTSKFEGPWADELLDLRTGEWREFRPVTRVEKCRQCGWCALYCPSGCVEERQGHFAANLDYCKGCGVCVHECPAKAIMLVAEEG